MDTADKPRCDDTSIIQITIVMPRLIRGIHGGSYAFFLEYAAALSPASLPKTVPAIRPLPPG